MRISPDRGPPRPHRHLRPRDAPLPPFPLRVSSPHFRPAKNPPKKPALSRSGGNRAIRIEGRWSTRRGTGCCTSAPFLRKCACETDGPQNQHAMPHCSGSAHSLLHRNPPGHEPSQRCLEPIQRGIAIAPARKPRARFGRAAPGADIGLRRHPWSTGVRLWSGGEDCGITGETEACEVRACSIR